MKNEIFEPASMAAHPNQARCERNWRNPARRLRIIILLVVFAFMTGTALAKNLNASSSTKSKKARVVLTKNAKAKKERAKITKRMKRASLMDNLAALAKKLGVTPDAIELARYAIKYPDHFASVVSHATAQDYPFFALVAAVKALRDKDLGNGLGTFTLKKCESPMTVIDVVFGKADTFIDDANAKGRQDTNVVTGLAKEYAAQYAKEKVKAAKDQLIAELAQNIPYFGELPTICSFGFEANLQAGRDIQDVVTDKAKKFQKAYQAFSDGDYADGVAILITLGADAGMACNFVDQAVSGGLLSRTPVLGTLVVGACKGIGGAVIDGVAGIVKGGVGAVVSGYDAAAEWGCMVSSLVGPGCTSAPPPPTDTATNVQNGAASWCQGRGGAPLNKIQSGPDHYKFVCGDGSTCEKKAGLPQKCVTAKEKADWEAYRKGLLQGALHDAFWSKDSMLKDLMKIETRWAGSCPADVKCRQDINVATFEARAKIEAAAGANSTAYYPTISAIPLAQAFLKAAQAVRDSEFRVLPPKWTADFNARWLPGCKGDQECVNKITFIRGFVQSGVTGTHMKKPEAPHSSMSPIYAEAETAARSYFRSFFKSKADAKEKEKVGIEALVNQAVRDATGRDATAEELTGYVGNMKNGGNIADIHAFAVAQMNGNPRLRAAMISRGYRAAYGREPKPGDLAFWQPQTASYKELIKRERDFLYSPAGAEELKNAVMLKLFQKTGKRPTPQEIDVAIETYKLRKMIFVEML